MFKPCLRPGYSLLPVLCWLIGILWYKIEKQMVEVEWDAIPRNGLLLLQEQELKTIVIGIVESLKISTTTMPTLQAAILCTQPCQRLWVDWKRMQYRLYHMIIKHRLKHRILSNWNNSLWNTTPLPQTANFNSATFQLDVKTWRQIMHYCRKNNVVCLWGNR